MGTHVNAEQQNTAEYELNWKVIYNVYDEECFNTLIRFLHTDKHLGIY